MHNSAIQQSRVASDDLLCNVLTRYDSPKIRRVRVYAPGVEPVEPNPYKFAVIAEIDEGGFCTITLMQDFPGVTLSDMKAGFEHLKQFGAVKMGWRHKANEQVFSPA